MNIKLSLKQSWVAIVIFASLTPILIVLIWYTQKYYSDQIEISLGKEHHSNEILSTTINSEIKRFKSVLTYNSDTLNNLIKHALDTNTLDKKVTNKKMAALLKINQTLATIKQREPAIHGLMVVTKTGRIVAAIDPDMGITGDKLLAASELQAVSKFHHWSGPDLRNSEEIMVPFSGKKYISSPVTHNDIKIHDSAHEAHANEINFYISIPISQPPRAVLLAEINIDKLWQSRISSSSRHQHGISKSIIVDYLINNQGNLITDIGIPVKPGSQMETWKISNLIQQKDFHNSNGTFIDSFNGVLKKPVFATLTKIDVLNWTIVSEIPVGVITKPILESVLKIGLYASLLSIVFLAIVIFIIQKTIAPIKEVCSAIEHVAQGDYDFQLNTNGITELDTLINGFNQMSKKRQEADIYQKNIVDELEHKNSELERFTYTVSHDLKSPLVTISGFIGFLRSDIENKNEARIEKDFNIILNAVNDMQVLLKDLLTLSRIGQRFTPYSHVIVKDLIDSVKTQLTSQIETSQAQIKVDSGLPTIFVDEPRFKEVFLNLIENSIKYRRENFELKISISSPIASATNEHIFIVQDNGIGIDKRYKSKVFDLFERLDNSSDGSGVGLAIVKRIIEVHHGRIWLESDGPDTGTKFFFFFFH